ncbi:MAG: hypothetical protein ACR2PT_07175 [Endozoicomonas sp.]
MTTIKILPGNRILTRLTIPANRSGQGSNLKPPRCRKSFTQRPRSTTGYTKLSSLCQTEKIKDDESQDWYSVWFHFIGSGQALRVGRKAAI